ncbi:MAG: GT4 family glycosyltransferase PelF [Bacillota bacterium]|nr:GT4 family glycosyltransferase PelF [Bacillota bacterium]
MKICMIAEGSYPYVTGGVSSWIQMLIRNMPEHEFIIFAIGAEAKSRGKFSYRLPENVIDVKEVFLDDVADQNGAKSIKFEMNNDNYEAIKSLITGRNFDWENLFSIVSENRIKDINGFLKCKDFFKAMVEAYNDKYSGIPFLKYFWNARSMLFTLFSAIMERCPEADLYHSVSTGYAGVIGSIAKYIYKKPFVITEHGIYTREREEDIIKSRWIDGNLKDMWINFFYSLSKCAYDSADKVITLFERNRELQVELGCDKIKTEIIPNGVNVNNFKGITTKNENDESINIGAVVRITPIKDIKTMIQSFSLVKEEIGNAVLYIMGPWDEDEEYYKECQELIAANTINDIHFTGKVNIKDYIGKMDLLLLTSISEGQPLAILEGMACSKPFVSTNVGSCQELLYGKNDSYGMAGFVAPVMNYEMIAENIISLCKNKALRHEMGKNAFKRVSTIYTEEHFISKYKELYSSFRR